MEGFLTPEQISIPMSVPIKLISDSEVATLMYLYEEIDACEGIETIDEIRKSIQDFLKTEYMSQKN